MKSTKSEPTVVGCGAVFDQARRHRYQLWRRWGHAGRWVTFVMLNPSTADESADDPTIRSCTRLARAWGMGGFRAVNLFSLCATNPRELLAHACPVGADNDRVLREAAADAALVVAAWGTHGVHLGRAAAVCFGPLADVELYCLGVNQNGTPRHPLYAATSTALARYEVISTQNRVLPVGERQRGGIVDRGRYAAQIHDG